ncbi:MAG: DUF29 domain-containing protein [Rhodospirillales bacterium]|nr:DUF29 domain-containing protein [Rhodospirillales bacterium]
MSDLYDTDFYAWANEQAALLRAGKLSVADIAHIAEEIDSMGRSERRELTSRLAVLLTHLLKWQVQPERRGRSWLLTIREQRREVDEVLADNPSLRARLSELLAEAYGKALLAAQRETDLPEEAFPAASPWTFDEAMQDAPDGA